jgi:hypothetical protein
MYTIDNEFDDVLDIRLCSRDLENLLFMQGEVSTALKGLELGNAKPTMRIAIKCIGETKLLRSTVGMRDLLAFLDSSVERSRAALAISIEDYKDNCAGTRLDSGISLVCSPRPEGT